MLSSRLRLQNVSVGIALAAQLLLGMGETPLALLDSHCFFEIRRFHSNWKRWRKKLRTTPELLVPVSKKKMRCSTIQTKRRPPVVKPAERERRRLTKVSLGRTERGRAGSLIRAGSPGPGLLN